MYRQRSLQRPQRSRRIARRRVRLREAIRDRVVAQIRLRSTLERGNGFLRASKPRLDVGDSQPQLGQRRLPLEFTSVGGESILPASLAFGHETGWRHEGLRGGLTSQQRTKR